MTKRDLLGYLSLGLAVLAAVAVSWYYFFVPYTLRIAVAPSGSEPAQFLSALAVVLKREEAPVRLVVVPFATTDEVATALDRKKVDMAAVRSDTVLPTSAEGVAVLHQYVVVTLARPHAGIEKFADLEGKTVVVLGAGDANKNLFLTLAGQHGIAPGVVLVRQLASPQALAAASSEPIDAVFFAAPRGGRGPAVTVRVLEERFGLPPIVVPLGELAPLLNRNLAFAKEEIQPGELGAALPTKAVPTLKFPALIVARRQLAAGAVQEFTKQLFNLRQALAVEYPAGGRIAALSTDRAAPFAVHPGAAVYYDASETSFLERYSDLTWLLLFGFSGVASLAAWIVSMALPKKRELLRAERDTIVGFLEQARAARTIADIEDIERRVDELIVAISNQVYRGDVDRDKQPAFDLLLARVDTILDRKRQALATER